MALIYRGPVLDVSEVEVRIDASGVSGTEILATDLQWGYKLYGPGYGLIDTPDTSCLEA